MKYLIASMVLIMGTSCVVNPLERVDLRAVGMSVELDGKWATQSRPDGVTSGASFGYHYLVEIDTSANTGPVFNEFLVERSTYRDEDQPESWLTRTSVEQNPKIDVLGPVDLREMLSRFDDFVGYEFEQARGEGRLMTTAGYVVHAIQGPHAYRITVSGLRDDFAANSETYKSILNSIELD